MKTSQYIYIYICHVCTRVCNRVMWFKFVEKLICKSFSYANYILCSFSIETAPSLFGHKGMRCSVNLFDLKLFHWNFTRPACLFGNFNSYMHVYSYVEIT